MINDARRLFISWRLTGGLLNRYSFRTRGPAAGGGLLLTFRLHIGGGLGRGIEIHGVLLVVPHHQVARRKKVFYRAAIATVGYIQSLLHINGAESAFIYILVATQIEVQAEGYTGQFDEGLLPFINSDL